MTNLVRIAVLISAAAGAAHAQVYFADIFNPDPSAGSIKQAGFDGSGPTTVLTTGGGLRSFALNAGKVYWADADLHAIRRANLDGSGVQTFITRNVDFPSAVRVDAAASRVYWGDQTLNLIGRANLTGGNNRVITSTPFFRGLAVDPAAGRLYWTTSLTATSGDIRFSALDGSGTQTIVSSAADFFKPGAIALDVAGGKVYWTDPIACVVRRAGLDGNGQETLYASGGLSTRGIALDLSAGKVYWGQDTDFKGGPFGALMRMGLSGANPEVFLGDLGLVQDIVVVPQAAPCYANCDNSTTPPILNALDFVCFISHYVAGDSYANCDGSTTPPVLNILDFSCFLQKFVAGCS